MPPCAPSCFLWSILRRTKRLLERQFEVREDLEDLLQNKPAWREATMQKIDAIEKTIKVHSLKAEELQNCLDNGCDDCFPENGVPYEWPIKAKTQEITPKTHNTTKLSRNRGQLSATTTTKNECRVRLTTGPLSILIISPVKIFNNSHNIYVRKWKYTILSYTCSM